MRGEPTVASTVSAEEVKGLRERTGWSTYELAEKIGCNQSTIWRIESNALPAKGAINKALSDLIAKHPPVPDPQPAEAAAA
jgi:ribosome-binding protein aMBF1 (putative translation factor)